MTAPETYRRIFWIKKLCLLLFAGVILRLFYWQIIKGTELRAAADQQYTFFSSVHGSRGKIFTSDGHLLVGNKPIYTLFAQPHLLKKPAKEIALLLADALHLESHQEILDKLSEPNKKWVALKQRVTEEEKNAIIDLHLFGVGLDQNESRYYPEASLAANITGFVGKEESGKETGYFGIEGKFNLELASKDTVIKTKKDAKGVPLFFQMNEQIKEQNGRDITLTIHRDIQYMLEQKIQEGVKKYGAVSGEVIVMDPQTGNILGMAVTPSYDQEKFFDFGSEKYKNPLVADGYEPGSTFKVLTVAAGIDSGVVNPETQCTKCATSRQISGYTIKTWNDQYIPNITIKDAIAKSDNTAMIFTAEQVGEDKFIDYIKRFKIGEPSGIELQEDAGTPLKKNWREIDLATASFGQGIATTGLQMMRAVSAIANEGKMVRPKIVESVMVDGKSVPVETEIVGEPISAQTAQTVTDIMVYAAQKGEAQWTTSKRYTVAGKTGTAQVAVAGQYDEDKTIASYIGFAPAYNPRFIMLVKLTEPTYSPWASETAAPLWYNIAQDLFTRMNIPPDRPDPTQQ
jgi:stage V sporulation protein D (sporulation-specific penicillin-binding protein)